MQEAHVENNGDIRFNGWFRICLSLIAVIFSLVLAWSSATLAYTYTTILPQITANLITTDKESRARDLDLQKQINENRVLIVEVAGLKAEIVGMRTDIERIKNILERK